MLRWRDCARWNDRVSWNREWAPFRAPLRVLCDMTRRRDTEIVGHLVTAAGRRVEGAPDHDPVLF